MNKNTCLIAGSIVFLLLAALPVFAGRPVSDTRQTKCYDTDGNEIPCAGTGQDGEFSINPMSFTKLDDAGRELKDNATEWVMVRDNVTGLIWEVKQNKDEVKDYANPHDADNTYTWYDPNPATNGGNAGTPGDGIDTLDFISALNAAGFGGFSDWRMPSREELRSIVDYSISFPGPTTNMIYFSISMPSYYWSSSSDAYYPDYAWCIVFDYGLDGYGYKSDAGHVRAVRGGQ